MSDKTIYKFGDITTTPHEIIEEIESRGYKKAVRSFQAKYPKLKNVLVMWSKKEIELSKEQRLPMGRFKKVGK